MLVSTALWPRKLLTWEIKCFENKSKVFINFQSKKEKKERKKGKKGKKKEMIMAKFEICRVSSKSDKKSTYFQWKQKIFYWNCSCVDF